MKNIIELPRDLVIPTKLLLNEDIECEYKQLYMYISFRCSTRGYIWYTNKALAEHLNKSTRAIERALKALADAKWLKIENRVKKGKLYDRDYRRVIWIYSDYLVAKDKQGGYTAVKPLSFSKMRTRFINAIADETKINQILHFFPMLKFLGKMRIAIDPNTKEMSRYRKNAKGAWELLMDKVIVNTVDKTHTQEILPNLYDFYKSQHQNQAEQTPEPKPTIDNFANFQEHIRQSYAEDAELSVNALGMLTKFDEEKNTNIILAGDEAVEWWQWLFTNQQKITERILLENGDSNG